MKDFPMRAAVRELQDRRELQCLAWTGHVIQPWDEHPGQFGCALCGLRIDLRKKTWWQRFLWDLRGRR